MMTLLNVYARDIGFPSDCIANDDSVFMPLQVSTQWDSLAHVGYDNCFYNGVETKYVTAHAGAAKNSIAMMAESLTTRGVLLDLVRYKNADAKGYSIRATRSRLPISTDAPRPRTSRSRAATRC